MLHRAAAEEQWAAPLLLTWTAFLNYLLQLCNKLNTITTIGDKELIRIESVEPGGEVSRQSLVINRHEKAAKV